jgi:hypothetical protein
VKSLPIVILLVTAGVFVGQSSSNPGRRFDNQYMTMTILSGWTVRPSVDQKLNLTQGKYILIINPIFTHASGVEGSPENRPAFVILCSLQILPAGEIHRNYL